MENATFLQNVWFLLVGVLLAGYSVLDGFDLGVGVLLPFLAQDRGREAVARRGRRTGLGRQRGLAAGRRRRPLRRLPHGLRHGLQRLLPGPDARAVRPHPSGGLARVPGARPETEGRCGRRPSSAAASSPRCFFGVALGNVVGGVPLDARTEFAGTFFTLLRPLPLVFGLLGLCAFLDARRRVRRAQERGALARDGPAGRRRVLAVAFAAAFALSFVAVLDLSPRRGPERPGLGLLAGRLAVARSSSPPPRRRAGTGGPSSSLRRPSWGCGA
ncbi:MAG: cytochrome d ubiquinol oxidase subunit II [Ignavibacteriales bacterium]|nr:cytochrome d ubiquinol oxidase subunit II [Ignavibacteriales bacterium]